MTFQASITGTYKTKVYINFILFKVVRGWRTDTFSWSQQVTEPELHLDLSPIKNLPIAIALDVTPTGVEFGIQVLSQDFPIEHISFTSGSKAFHWEPIKGVLIDATASFNAA